MRLTKKNTSLICAFLSLFCFLLLVKNVLSEQPPINFKINMAVIPLQNSFGIFFAKALDYIFGTEAVILAALLIAFYIMRKHKHLTRHARIFVIFLSLNALSVFFLKRFFELVRPFNALLLLDNYSFPSGHAASAVVFFGSLIYLSSHMKRFVWPARLIGLLSIGIISFSRLYLNVHWLTDVVAGLLLGTFWLCMSFVFMKR